ncbi:MAG: 4-alpha-glucanotransferase [Aphanocapsa sp. GSE-SYN-MK-11-07L]|jgi:4-alpha-glucanotransferase|nr:4-alpha-glucanotransferase [Aphanocapsa sp. GSE-SYN-MK-11-07L]
MLFPRSSGLLLHPTCLPSPHGIGDLGQAAYDFVNFLAAADQQFWQVLPLGPTGYGNSPYMCYSAIAGNPLLISLEDLRNQGLLTDEDLNSLPEFPRHTVDFDQVVATKIPLLEKAAINFQAQADEADLEEFHQFCQHTAAWLDDFALFMALKAANDGAAWHTWAANLAQRQPAAIAQQHQQLAAEIFALKFQQFEFFRQWSRLKAFANEQGIQIIGDIPIYVAHDSADVWANPQFFELDPETSEPAFMAGVPPDYFSATGQLWGNPTYAWDAMDKDRYCWWVSRFRRLLDFVDVIRVDHFRGFEAYWQVPKGEETAENGEWIAGPGAALFEVVAQELGRLPILAEDLGDITPEVIELRDQFEFPGMKILQFAFGSDSDNSFLPFNYARNCVVYTGTHDNDTVIGWYEQLSDYEQGRISSYLGCISPDGIHWDLIRLGLSSIANQMIIPLQDLFGLDTSARMNFPGKPEGNWVWRYQAEDLNQGVGDRLRQLTHLFGRNPKPRPSQD